MDHRKGRENDKLQGGEIAVGGRWRSKLDNFWFYHKWHVLLVLFVVLVLLVCVLQSRENKKDDVTLMFAGPYKLTATEVAALRTGLNDVMPEDFNGDGEKYAEMVMMQIYSEEQETAIRNTPDGEVPPYRGYIDSYYNDEQITSFDNLIMAGEYSICILDSWLYERVKGAGGFRKLSEVLGYTPEDAVDEYGVRFRDTAFSEFFTSTHVFPEDSILCIRRVSVMAAFKGQKKTERAHAYHTELFRSVMEFTMPE